MRILVAQLNQTIGAFEENTQRILLSLDEARRQKADIVLFSEMALCGYPPEDLLFHASFIEKMERSLQKVIAATEGLFVVVGIVRKDAFLHNSAAIICDKKLLGFHDKWLLPTYDVFDESRYFKPGEELRVWEYKGKKIAVTICEDLWAHGGFVSYAKDPVLTLKQLKPDLLLNLSASPFAYQKPLLRLDVCKAPVKTLGCPVIMCCQVGGMDQLVFDGYSFCVDAQGVLRERAKGFEEDYLLIDLSKPHSTPSPSNPIEDVYKALVLGVRDYFHKQGFTRACLGLSGGIDSALVASIAKEALGKENVLAVIMPSRYSSLSSMEDAKALAKNLEISFREVPIEGPFTSYLNLLELFWKGKPHDITEENMQSRIRGMILMAISNKEGYLVLNTGNKSELALGYCTLYGDMCGALGVISDVLKTQVYKLSEWINKEKEVIPRSIINKAPTAELKHNQKDTDTLPEYAILDVVIEEYIENLLSKEAIARKHVLALPLVKDVIHRIHLAEYKRRQAPPGIRVSKKSFQVGRRYPIVEKHEL